MARKLRHPVIAAAWILAASIQAWAATAVHSPYLQNVGADRATIVWSTRENMRGTVQYSTDRNFTLTATDQIREFLPDETGLSQPFYQHRADLRGLQPGVEYFYRVIMSDGTNLALQPDHHFRTAGAGPMTFLVFGDSGSGSQNQQAMTQVLLKERPDFILHVGDMAYEEGTYDQFRANYFDPYGPLLRRAPLFPTPGNHEYYTAGAAPYLNLHAVPADSVPAPDRGRYYSFNWGAVHFISLDSNLLDDGTAASRMLAWLEQDLRNTAAIWRVAYFHHLPYPLDHHLDDPYCANTRRQFVPLLERYGVQLVFTGHEHIYERTKPLRADVPVSAGRGTVYVTTGGAGAVGHGVLPRDFVAKSAAAYHYLRVEADESNITIHAIEKDGRSFDTAVLSTPSIGSSEAVVNGASFVRGLAPGGIISIFGKGLATVTEQAAGVPLPAALGGTMVTVNGEPLPLYYVSPGQINAQLRMDMQGPATLRVITASGSTDMPIDISDAAPGIFSGALQHANGTSVSTAAPAKAGEILVVYAAGLGAVDRAIAAGEVSLPAPLARVMSPVTVLIDGVPVTPDFAGLTPRYVGLYQVNVRLPSNLSVGEHTLRLSTRGNTSNLVRFAVGSRAAFQAAACFQQARWLESRRQAGLPAPRYHFVQ